MTCSCLTPAQAAAAAELRLKINVINPLKARVAKLEAQVADEED